MYEDKTLVCKECGKEFTFTAGEQEFYAERGFQNEPQRCKSCRDARKNATRGPRANDDVKLEEYKQIIYNEFFPKRGEPKFRFSICRKAISDFKKLKPHPSCIAELMVFYVELGVNFSAEYGDMWEDYYITIENNFGKALEFLYKNGLLTDYLPRIKKMLEASEKCGWGFSYGLYYYFEKYSS